MQKVISILGYLSDQLIRGWAAYVAAKHLYQARQKGRLSSSRHFFTAAYSSCMESSLLSLSRMLVSHDDSVSIKYLLNCATNDADNFPYASKETVLRSVSSHRAELSQYSPFLKTLKGQRDTTLAHLDRKYVNDPAEIFSIPIIDMETVEEVYRILIRIVNTYKGYAEDSEIRVLELETDIAGDLAYLTEVIESANARD